MAYFIGLKDIPPDLKAQIESYINKKIGADANSINQFCQIVSEAASKYSDWFLTYLDCFIGEGKDTEQVFKIAKDHKTFLCVNELLMLISKKLNTKKELISNPVDTEIKKKIRDQKNQLWSMQKAILLSGCSLATCIAFISLVYTRNYQRTEAYYFAKTIEELGLTNLFLNAFQDYIKPLPWGLKDYIYGIGAISSATFSFFSARQGFWKYKQTKMHLKAVDSFFERDENINDYLNKLSNIDTSLKIDSFVKLHNS